MTNERIRSRSSPVHFFSLQTWLNQTESMLSRLEEVPSEISSNSALAHLEKCKAAIDEIKTKKVVLDGLEEKYNTLLGPGMCCTPSRDGLVIWAV